MGDNLCVVCRHRTPAQGRVCGPDRARIAAQLSDLPRKLRMLNLELVPGAAPVGDKVSVSRFGSPPPARIDALTLLAPGSDGVSQEAVDSMTHQKVRRWRTVDRVAVTVGGHTEDRDVVTWHQELVVDDAGDPAFAIDDDQVGLLPPAEWLDQWVRTWRLCFGHYQRTRPAVPQGGRPGNGRPEPGLVHPQKPARLLAGLDQGDAVDPVADEWRTRFGEPQSGARVDADVRYLLTWLDRACDEDFGVADLSAELRTLTAELARVLHETPDQQDLGCCPATLADRATGGVRPCGARLWQDPYASQVTCPRCRSAWGPGKPAMLRLAAEIRRVWPIDRRRRYSLAEIQELARGAVVSCPSCAGPLRIEWQETTGVNEQVRTWRPDRVACVAGCPDAGRVMAS